MNFSGNWQFFCSITIKLAWKCKLAELYAMTKLPQYARYTCVHAISYTLMKYFKGNKKNKLHWKLLKFAFLWPIIKMHDHFNRWSMYSCKFYTHIIFFFFSTTHTFNIYNFFTSSKICTTADWRNGQWFCGGSIECKHNSLLTKFMIFCDWSCKQMIIS